jgi:cytochrome bd-type quinol oxidase subunit 1
VIGQSVAVSLAAFVVVYGFIFGAGAVYIFRLIGKGPVTENRTYGDHGIRKPPVVPSTVS